jgi:hypothetical protein
MTPVLDETRAGVSTAVAAARRTAPGKWAGVAVPIAALSTWLAWGAVTPPASGAIERVAVVPLAWPAIASALAVLAAGLWLRRRGSAGPLWLSALSLVPWLPAPAWGPLLLWHGPASPVPLAAAAVLVAWPALARAAGAVRARAPREQAAIAFLACVAVYGIAGWRMQPQLPGGDEPHYLVITQSLLLDGDLRIENNHVRGDYRAYTDQTLKPDSLKRGRDGQIYSIHAPGLAALVLPAFALAGYPGVVAWLVLCAALGAAIAWWAAWRLTSDAGAAWVGWAVVALSAPFFFESFTVFPDGPGAVIVMALVAALVAPAMLASPGRALALGACAAMLPWLHTRYAILAGVLGVLAAIRIVEHPPARGTRLAAFLAVPVASAAAWLWFFHAIYGTFNPAAPYGGYTQSALSNVPRGLTGLLLDQQFGILPNAPAYAVALAGIAALWRLRRRLAIEIAAVVVPYAIAVACYHMWWGGRSAVARFAVPVLLPLALPAAAFWQRTGRTGHAFAGVAIVVSAALACGLAWVERGALVFNFRDGYALWADAIAPLVRLPLALPSLFRGTPADAWAIGLAWIAAMGGAVFVVRALEQARADRGTAIVPGTFRAIVAGAALVAATGAAAIGWQLGGGPAVDAGSGLVRLLDASEARSARAWRSSAPWSLEAPDEVVASLRIPTAERRPTDPAAPEWSAAGLPPGRYEVRSTSGLRVSGRLSAMLGRDPLPIAEARFADVPPGALPLGLRLPAGASSLRIVADAEARRTTGAIELGVVERFAPRAHPAGAYGRTRLPGSADTWFLDGNAFVEPAGFWVRGEAETAFVIDGKGRAFEIVLRAGAVPTTATVAVGEAPEATFELGPGASAVIGGGSSGPVALRVASSSGFRPRDHDPSNPDARWLGVHVDVDVK